MLAAQPREKGKECVQGCEGSFDVLLSSFLPWLVMWLCLQS